MAIVPAAVHQAWFGRAPGKIVLLAHRQRVHVGTQADGATGFRLRSTDYRHDTGLANAAVNLIDAADAQCFSDALRRALFFESELRMRMQVAPKGSELAVPSGKSLVHT